MYHQYERERVHHNPGSLTFSNNLLHVKLKKAEKINQSCTSKLLEMETENIENISHFATWKHQPHPQYGVSDGGWKYWPYYNWGQVLIWKQVPSHEVNFSLTVIP